MKRSLVISKHPWEGGRIGDIEHYSNLLTLINFDVNRKVTSTMPPITAENHFIGRAAIEESIGL